MIRKIVASIVSVFWFFIEQRYGMYYLNSIILADFPPGLGNENKGKQPLCSSWWNNWEAIIGRWIAQNCNIPSLCFNFFPNSSFVICAMVLLKSVMLPRKILQNHSEKYDPPIGENVLPGMSNRDSYLNTIKVDSGSSGLNVVWSGVS